MRLFINMLFFAIFISCGGAKSQYLIEKEMLVHFEEAYYQSYISGIKGGGSGTSIFLIIDSENSKDVEIEGIYFQKKYSKLKLHGNNKYQGYVKGNVNWEKEAAILEEKNKSTKTSSKKIESFPFDLKQNEAVISFLHKGKLKYNKIELSKKEVKTKPM